MTNKVFCVLATLLLSSCSNDWSAGLADQRTSSLAAPSTESVEPAGAFSSPTRAAAARSFAGAPDRGSLVQYPKDPVVRRSGAYTWHAADLSEDHALRSTITGDLSFTAPDGTPINLAYERHIEHPDGNWSWIGRGEGERGESTVITFGEAAAFGTIPQGGDKPPLRLTISDGRAWVVAADPRLLREIRNEATHPTKPDFLVPPKLAIAAASATGGMEALGAQAVSPTSTSGTTVVDVLVGFTDGYSAYRSGASAATTRIHNLIEVTNQAYRNSQVNAVVRLVHTMQVSYPDATTNKTALEELTGFKAPSTRTTPAPAFSALRSARDQYGADLVVLLRRFQTPENDGCGIAWLIGGGRSGIGSSDEFFGYSVVGDGQDAGTDGKTYFCREETLAHELGHNMGVQHDRASATVDGSLNYGVHQYSFGYKTAADGGYFYTVMAYGDSGQKSFRTFSNPRSTFCGVPCGVENEADSARSLAQTIPLIANFRKAIAPQKSRRRDDIDADGNSDLLWHNFGSRRFQGWEMNGSSLRYAPLAAIGAYTVEAIGDFNGDGYADVLWVDTARTEVWQWQGRPDGTYAALFVRGYPQGWLPVGVGDANADGRDDVFWHNATQGRLQVWRMSGAQISYGPVSSIGSYRVDAIGDFNGDNLADILWVDTGSTQVWQWKANADGGYSPIYVAAFPGSGWKVVGADDANGDGIVDLFWHNAPLRVFQVWQMQSAGVTYGSLLGIGNYTAQAIGDFNGDGLADVIWVDEAQTQIWSWLANGNGTYSSSFVRSYPAGWSLVNRKPSTRP